MTDLTECKYCGVDLEPGRAQCKRCRKFNLICTEEDTGPRFLSFADAPEVPNDRIMKKSTFGPVFGKGIAPRQCMLLGGGPGNGKSTFGIQFGGECYEETGKRVLYAPTEEDPADIRERMERLKVDPEGFVFPVERPDEALAFLDDLEEEFSLVITDSLPDLIGTDLNEGVRVLKRMKEFSTESQTPTLVINHVIKGELLAGLKRLEHVVDTTMFLMGNETTADRILRVKKNRFGPGHQTMKLVMTGKDAKIPGKLVPVDSLNQKPTTKKKKS
jgi:DNA repair protein RadA/Sms